jgi:hypothetical protein
MTFQVGLSRIYLARFAAYCGTCGQPISIYETMIALVIPVVFAAAGYSLIYLLGGGGLFGAIVIFIVAKMLGK